MFEIIESGDLPRFREEIRQIRQVALNGNENPEQACLSALNAKNELGRSLVHVAAEKGNLEILEDLLSFDLVSELKDEYGKTPEQLALDAGKEDAAALLRTRGKWQQEARSSLGFRFNRAVRLLEDSFVPIQAGAGKQQVLFIGKTGAGKSTLINYLMGTRYCLGRKRFKRYAKVISGNEVARVGHRTTSETLYPQTFSKPGLGFSYCDLAGFGENRGGEEGICAACGPQMLTNVSSGIKGIILVLDFPSFESSRGAHFREMMALLSKIVRQEDQVMADNVYFVITKIPVDLNDLTIEELLNDFIRPILGKKTVFGQVGEALSGANNRSLYSRLKRGDLSEEEMGELYVLHSMSENPDRILLSNIFDQGQSAQKIESAIAKNCLRNKRDFNFLSTDGHQVKFNTLLGKLASEFLKRKNCLELKFPEAKKILTKKRSEITDELSELNKEIELREREQKNSKRSMLANIQREIIETEKKITNSKSKIEELRFSKFKLRNTIKDSGGLESRLKEAENPEKVKLWEQKFTPNYSKHAKGSIMFHSRGKTFNYTGIPFTRVESSCNVGAFSSVYVNKEAGKFSSTYDCQGDPSANAMVTIYTERNLLPEWQEKINNLKLEIKSKEKQMSKIESELDFVQSKIKIWKSEVSQKQQSILTGQLETEEVIAQLNAEIRSRKTQIALLEKSLGGIVRELASWDQLILSTKLEIKVNVKLFITLYHIFRVTDYRSKEVGESVQEFEKTPDMFLKSFENYMTAEGLIIPDLAEAIKGNLSEEMPLSSVISSTK